MANYAQYDPRLERHARNVEDFYNNFPQQTERQINLTAGKIRDLGEGQKKAAAASAASRGVLGTSTIPEYTNRQIDQDVMGRAAGASAEISMQADRDKAGFLLGSTGALAAPGEAARADRAGARADQAMEYDRWRVMEEGRRAQEAADLQRWMMQMEFALRV